MTTFFMILALLHVAGLFVMLMSLRRAPVAVETRGGLQVVEGELAEEALAALAKNAA